MSFLNVLTLTSTGKNGVQQQKIKISFGSENLLSMQGTIQPILQETSIPEQSQTSQGAFPLVYVPRKDSSSSHIYLQEYIIKNKARLLETCNKHGAVLFRGFSIESPNEATSVLNQLGLKAFKYIGGAAVRKLIIGSENPQQNNTDGLEMFTTNEAPPNKPIPFHNELLQTKNYPEYISFYCFSEAETGGATPILSCTKMFEYLQENHKEFLTKLKGVGVKYQRVVGKEDNPDSPIGRGWAGIFGVKTKEEAEKKMKEEGFEWEWLENDDLRLSSGRLEGVIEKTKSGVSTFTNQILAVFKGWIDDKNSPQKCLKFGNGQAMPMDLLKDVYQYAQKIQVVIPWQKGDLILIDNHMAMHARQPFTGPFRRVFACLMSGESSERVKQEPKPYNVTQVLHSGYELPLIGFGTWKIPKEECPDVVYKAIKNGYRLLDCACDYGNEKEVGEGIQRAIKEGIVTRKELFVTSKLWNTYHRREHVEAALKKTLSDLDLEYLDLYLIHFPISLQFVPFEERYPPEWVFDPKAPKPYMKEDKVPISETWQAMERLVEGGLARNIGVSNFKIVQLRELLYTCKIRPAVLQVELHPELSQKRLLRFCRAEGIQVTSFSTFGASSYIELGMAGEDDPVFKKPIIKEIATQYKGKSPHQIILRWAVQQGVAIIPKSVKEDRMQQNINVLLDREFVLSEEHMNRIDQLNKDRRYNDPGHFCEVAFGTFFPIHE